MENKEYNSKLVTIISSIKEEKRTEFVSIFNARSYNPVVVFGLSLFMGALAVDRFVLGQPLLSILKLISFGGFGIWILVDYFLVGSAARRKNIEIATAVADGLKE